MSDVLIYTQDDTLIVVHKSPRIKEWDEVIQRSVPKGIEWRIIPIDSLPSEREFRGAWVDKSGAVTVDLEKAKGIYLSRIRETRNALLSEYDKLFMKALTTGDVEAQAKISAKMQELRDVPQDLDLSGAATVDEMKCLYPKVLKEDPKEVLSHA